MLGGITVLMLFEYGQSTVISQMGGHCPCSEIEFCEKKYNAVILLAYVCIAAPAY